MLRRGYNFVDGSNGLGRLDAGLFFIAYVVDPRTHFIPIQTKIGIGDAMSEYVQHTGSALFAVPPGVEARRVRGSGAVRLNRVVSRTRGRSGRVRPVGDTVFRHSTAIAATKAVRCRRLRRMTENADPGSQAPRIAGQALSASRAPAPRRFTTLSSTCAL